MIADKEEISKAEAELRVMRIYKEMINYYNKEGIGQRSKYAGVIIREKLIDILTRRYLQLGGSLKEIA